MGKGKKTMLDIKPPSVPFVPGMVRDGGDEGCQSYTDWIMRTMQKKTPALHVVFMAKEFMIVEQDSAHWKWWADIDGKKGVITFKPSPHPQSRCVDCEEWMDTDLLTENNHCQACVRI